MKKLKSYRHSCLNQKYYRVLFKETIDKLPCFFSPPRFYPKWHRRPLLRSTPCWETNHTWRKRRVLEDAKQTVTDYVSWQENRGNLRFLLCCILKLHVLRNIMLPVCAHTHFCATNCIMYNNNKKRKFLSAVKRKKQKGSYIAHCQLFADFIDAKWLASAAHRNWETVATFSCSQSTGHGAKVEKKSHLFAWMQHFWLNGAFAGRAGLLPLAERQRLAPMCLAEHFPSCACDWSATLTALQGWEHWVACEIKKFKKNHHTV